MKLAVAAAALLCSFNATSQEPLTFKGFSIGAGKAEFTSAFPGIKCTGETCIMAPSRDCSYADPQQSECFKAMSYGGFLPDYVAAKFENDRLVSVYISVPEPRFRSLSVAMKERFGAPTQERDRPVQNRAGATFDNKVLVWRAAEGQLTLTQRAGKIDQSSVFLISLKYAVRATRENLQKAKESAKDL